jgi:hypothetical protein
MFCHLISRSLELAGLRRTLVLLFATTLAVAISACGSPRLANGVYKDPDVHYRVGAPGAGWSEIVVDNANAAWFHDGAKASLMVSSHCKGVDDAPLEALTRHLTIGMTEVEILSETRTMLSRREALETEILAKLDGVPRRQVILVLKKDACVYDIVLDASPATFDTARAGYDAVKSGFTVESRPGRSS